MAIFVLFILSAVLIGVGVMLAPALPTEKTAIGLASSLTLLFILSGCILWTRFVGWDTLLVDYLLFGSVSVVILGGTMMQAQADTPQAEQAQSSVTIRLADVIFWVGIALISLVPLMLFVAQAVTINHGDLLAQLVSETPTLGTFGTTGFHLLSLYLAQQLRVDAATVQPAVLSVFLLITSITAYDLGNAWHDAAIGKMVSVIVLCGLVVAIGVQQQAISWVMGALVATSGGIFALRSLRYRQWCDVLATIAIVSMIWLI